MARTHTYTYTFDKTINSGQSDAAQIEIADDVVKFDVTAISAMVVDVTGAVVGITKANEQLPLLLANIKPSVDEAGMCNVPTPLHMLAGTSGEPRLLDEPWSLAGNTKPVLTLQNLTTDKNYRVFVSLHGSREKK